MFTATAHRCLAAPARRVRQLSSTTVEATAAEAASTPAASRPAMRSLPRTGTAPEGGLEQCPHGSPQGRQALGEGNWGSGNIKRGGGRLEMFKFGLYLMSESRRF